MGHNDWRSLYENQWQWDERMGIKKPERTAHYAAANVASGQSSIFQSFQVLFLGRLCGFFWKMTLEIFNLRLVLATLDLYLPDLTI